MKTRASRTGENTCTEQCNKNAQENVLINQRKPVSEGRHTGVYSHSTLGPSAFTPVLATHASPTQTKNSSKMNTYQVKNEADKKNAVMAEKEQVKSGFLSTTSASKKPNVQEDATHTTASTTP